MKAFHGDPAIKEKYLARLKAHHVADEIVQGQRWDGSRGCAVGCTLNKYVHNAYETELGLPQWLAHLEDRIFEGLPTGAAQRFAVDFLEAVPVGADVEKVQWLLAVQRHTRDRDRLSENPEPYAKQCVAAINQMLEYCMMKIAGTATESDRAAWSAWSAHWKWEAETLLDLLRNAPQAAE